MASLRAASAASIAGWINSRVTFSATPIEACSMSARIAVSSSWTPASVTRTRCSATDLADVSAIGFAAASAARRAVSCRSARASSRMRRDASSIAARAESTVWPRHPLRRVVHGGERFAQLVVRSHRRGLARGFGGVDRRLHDSRAARVAAATAASSARSCADATSARNDASAS
jgi:hypothetical protein